MWVGSKTEVTFATWPAVGHLGFDWKWIFKILQCMCYHDAPSSQISRQSANVWLSYWWLKKCCQFFFWGGDPKYRCELAQRGMNQFSSPNLDKTGQSRCNKLTLDFRYLATFWNDSISKSSMIENRGQILHFMTLPCKNWGVSVLLSSSDCDCD